MSLIDALKNLLDGNDTSSKTSESADPLSQTVAAHMVDATDETRSVVTAIAGLLAAVAFADQDYSPAEERHVREELGRVHGLEAGGVDAICTVLSEGIGRVVAAGDQHWVRDLRKLTEREQRVEILEVLLDLAAADDELSMAETNYLRRLATALGLEQSVYNAAQARHRDKLSALK
ncbi:MAG: TerB family tellurite resistance protein [Deltaproteobacteria bacterium]|nr:TerB family tellurite resistance protein [Deltaproteobacteria bacterium]